MHCTYSFISIYFVLYYNVTPKYCCTCLISVLGIAEDIEIAKKIKAGRVEFNGTNATVDVLYRLSVCWPT